MRWPMKRVHVLAKETSACAGQRNECMRWPKKRAHPLANETSALANETSVFSGCWQQLA
jgi:hypothetical protein